MPRHGEPCGKNADDHGPRGGRDGPALTFNPPETVKPTLEEEEIAGISTPNDSRRAATIAIHQKVEMKPRMIFGLLW